MTTTAVADATPTRPRGPWRAAFAGWRLFVPTVLINAVVQGALVVGDPVPTLSWEFWLLVAVSFISVVVAVWLVACTAAAAVNLPDSPTSLRPMTRSSWSTLGWLLVTAVVAVGAAVLHPLLPLLVFLLAALALPAVAAGGTLLSGLTAVAAAPVRYLLAVIGFLVLGALSWVVALVLGLFVTGPIAAGLTWLWFGLVLVVVLCVSTSLYRRAAPAGRR